jgi:thiol-disulfide isomerase/thioredoxin
MQIALHKTAATVACYDRRPWPAVRTRSPVPKHLLAAVMPALLLGLALPGEAAGLRSAPPLTATLLDGTGFSTAELRGKVIVINFWATWCAPCREEMPAIDTFYRRHRERGLEVIAVSLDEPASAGKVRTLMSDYAFPAALSAQARYRGYGRIWRVPMTFVIDRAGRLREDITASTLQVDLAFLESRVAPLLVQ